MTYDEQIAHLTEHPSQIYDAWRNFREFTLFMPIDDNLCPTEIRDRTVNKDIYESEILSSLMIFRPEYEELVENIGKDDRIPTVPASLTPEMLPAFKQYQMEANRIKESLL
jgi:hypothetical protein